MSKRPEKIWISDGMGVYLQPKVNSFLYISPTASKATLKENGLISEADITSCPECEDSGRIDGDCGQCNHDTVCPDTQGRHTCIYKEPCPCLTNPLSIASIKTRRIKC